jgi:antitoxin component YwqK of YwqJK toxin-antitoxin module
MRDVCEGITSLSKYFILIIFSSLLLIGCKSYHNTHNIYIEEGLIYKEGEEAPFTGRILDTLDSQILEYEVEKGLKNGEFCLTSTSGKIAVYGLLKNNKNEGKWKYFYGSGQLESMGGFRDDKPQGKWTWFYENGTVKEEGYFIEGYKIGKWSTFTTTGAPTSVTTYSKGEKVNEIKYSKARLL